MRVTALVENTSGRRDVKAKHGLSLFIETGAHKVLFDMGSDGLFLQNARKLGIAVEDVDIAILSHGHVDHGGALALFLENNDKARVYVQDGAFNRHFNKMLGMNIPVGIDPGLEGSSRIEIVRGSLKIDEGLLLFSDVAGRDLYPTSNGALYEKQGDRVVRDDFSHEQYLIVAEGNERCLVSGCAHKGIVNIVDEAERVASAKIDCCVSGFHLFNPITRKREPEALVEDVARELAERDMRFYTCHCTGKHAYNLLKSRLLDKIEYLSCGMTVEPIGAADRP